MDIRNAVLLPVLALYETQRQLDQMLIDDIVRSSTQQCELLVNDTPLTIPYLMLVGIRSTTVTSARITVEFKNSPMSIKQKGSSVTMDLTTTGIPELQQQILDA